MLARTARLNVSENFKWIRSGKRYESSHLRMFWQWGDNPKPLIGVAVNTKELKKANLRVKAKRLCFESARLLYSDLPSGLNLVIMPKPEILNSNVEELARELQNARFSR